jgi:hypothetical protein
VGKLCLPYRVRVGKRAYAKEKRLRFATQVAKARNPDMTKFGRYF